MAEINNLQYANCTPRAMRERIRTGEIDWNTSGMCAGYAQANLIVLPEAEAKDFLAFAEKNPKACPVLEVSEKGARGLKQIAADTDIAKDFPRYRIYEDGKMTGEYTDVSGFWRDDLVAFFIGCSFSFEAALQEAGVPIRHIEEGKNVPMYLTNIECEPAGMFGGNLVVSMRPMLPKYVELATSVTAEMPRVHGAPIHAGDPRAIGIADLSKPDFGDAVTVNEGEVPVFWCCGVTPQAAVMRSKPKFAITHAPGHMFITDVLNADLKN